MTPTKTRAPKKGARMTLARAQRMTGVTLDNADLGPLISAVKTASWITKLGPVDHLEAGELTEELMRIPQTEARTALRAVTRLVADLPRGTTPIVVWEERGSELEVDTAATTLKCTVGMVTIGVSVRCDQVPQWTLIEVPLGVGTEKRPTGLVMSALTAVAGPPIVVDRWSDALTAFGWECIIETARRLCELAGADSTGRPLTPGAVGAGSTIFLIQPMSAHGTR